MFMGMSQGLSQSIRQTQRMTIEISMPSIQWSLLQAYTKYGAAPPPYVEPTFEEEEFTPRLKLERQRIADFESLDHLERMKRVDEANELFRFAYTRGRDYNSGEEKYYFKIPLLRDRNIMNDPSGIDRIKIKISRAEYERACAILEAVGELERIARAVPYHDLYQAVVKHLRRGFKTSIDNIVLVSVDRGGRIPCIILQRALNFESMYSLKVDQGGRGLDMDRLREFAKNGTLTGKHILFVDSTVDSGRQIRALEPYFDSNEWKQKLGHHSWSIIGSNEYAQNLDHHQNINWGVDPDRTFEDDPKLMGIDYAPGDHTKVVECPSETSQAIRKCLLAVPDGFVYSATDINDQLDAQRKKWQQRQKERKAEHRKQVKEGKTAHQQEVTEYRQKKAVIDEAEKVERELERITASKQWQQLKATHQILPVEVLPEAVKNGQAHDLHNVLIVGSGRQDLPEATARFVADNLGAHCSLLAGTDDGNPGAVLKAVLNSEKVPQPEVRLYQPEYVRSTSVGTFGNTPVVFVGPEKKDMRRQMISDAHVVLALGGAEGTLREVLTALRMGKPTVIVEGYGPVAAYVLGSKRLRKRANLKACYGVAQAVQTILDASKK